MRRAQYIIWTNKILLQDLPSSKKTSQQCLLSREDAIEYPELSCHLSPIPAGETPQETLSRVSDMVHGWLIPERRTKEQIVDAVILEKFLALLPEDLQEWLRFRRPKNSKEAAEFVDISLQNQRPPHVVRNVMKTDSPCRNAPKRKSVLMAPKQNITYWEVLEEKNGTFNYTKDGEDIWKEVIIKEENIKEEENYNWPYWPQEQRLKEKQPWINEETSRSSLEKEHHPQICPKMEQEDYPTNAFPAETSGQWHEEYLSPNCSVMDQPMVFTELNTNHSGSLRRGRPTKREKSHPCKDCGKIFPYKSVLRNHQMIHTGDKPHGCPECGKHFRTRSNLMAHWKIHTGEKPHQCHECGKSFRIKSSLALHQRNHTGETPPVCWRRFSQQGKQIYNSQTHTNEQLYPCSTCGKSFRAYSSLIRHGRVHSRD
uniref:Uncharacterized protein n=1 Tax=Anolis carolinensis TaxID=28377 RepID=A0A803T2U9_ANOCA